MRPSLSPRATSSGVRLCTRGSPCSDMSSSSAPHSARVTHTSRAAHATNQEHPNRENRILHSSPGMAGFLHAEADWRLPFRSKQGLIIDRFAVEQEPFDGGAAGARYGGNHGHLAFVARLLQLAALAFRHEELLDAISDREPLAEIVED